MRQLVDSNQNVAYVYTYDAWGNLTAGGEAAVNNPFRYCGEEGYYTDLEPNRDLMLLGVRHYDSVIGRFITPDPVGLAGGQIRIFFTKPCSRRGRIV